MPDRQKDIISPLTLFYSYANSDEPLRRRLEKHLSILRHQNFIKSWHHRLIVPGTDWAQVTDSHLSTASIILLLISPDFLASDYCYGREMQRALERHKTGDARVIPVLLRPVDQHGAPFSHLQSVPRDKKAVTLWRNQDEAFMSIAQDIRLVCEELRTPLAYIIRKRIASEGQPGAPDHQESHIYPLFEVFVKSGIPTVTFVEREDFELLKLSLAQPGRGVVIEGSSGIGKTTTVKKAVEDLASAKRNDSQNGTSVYMLSARSPEDRNMLQTLPSWHEGTVIIDDFHRLDPIQHSEIVDYLKYLADTEPLSKKLVIVGIPQTGQTLVDTSFDMATRIDVFKLGLVKDELIFRMIEKGEKALNIVFDKKTEIVLAANGSLNIAQFLCFYICHKERLSNTQDQLKVAHCDIEAAIANVMTDLSRKFGESIRHFAAMGGQRDPTCLKLLEQLAHRKDGFLSLSLLKNWKPELADGIEQFLNEKWMELLYHEYPICAQHLFFDPSTQALVVDDPQLTFYLTQTPFSTLAKEVGKTIALVRRKVFISYSHKDARYVDRFRVHLAGYVRGGIVDLWDDTKIRAGAGWMEEIRSAIEPASVIVLLVSADFLASDFIREYQLPLILSNAQSGGASVYSVILGPCAFELTALRAYQTVNPASKPLTKMDLHEQEEVWVKLAEIIREELREEGF